MKRLIKKPRIKEQSCDLYDPNGKHLFKISNYLELNDVKIQIRRQALDGYYLIFNDQKIKINNKGQLESYPIGFFNLMRNQLAELVDWN